MIIGIDIRTLMDKQYSGVSEYTWQLLAALFELDKKNHYKLFYNSLFNPVQMPKFPQTNIEIIKTNYPNKVFNYIMQRQLNYPKIDRLLGVDLFFMPHINYISLSSSAKKVLTIHDLSFWRYPEFFSARKNFWHKLMNVKKMLQSFDSIIAVSENTKKDIIELGEIDDTKVKVVYSGINPCLGKINAPDQAAIHEIRRCYDLPQNFILYLGNLEPRKNIDGIIHSFDDSIQRYPQLAEYYLVIAGGKGWKNKRIAAAYSHAKNRKNIKFLGYIDDKDKNILYNLASLFIYPSYYEGFGFPPLEALSCGIPVISSPSSSLPEICKDCAIYANPHNINAISQALREGLFNSKLRAQISRNSQKIIANFSWEKAASQYLEIFNNLRKE